MTNEQEQAVARMLNAINATHNPNHADELKRKFDTIVGFLSQTQSALDQAQAELENLRSGAVSDGDSLVSACIKKNGQIAKLQNACVAAINAKEQAQRERDEAVAAISADTAAVVLAKCVTETQRDELLAKCAKLEACCAAQRAFVERFSGAMSTRPSMEWAAKRADEILASHDCGTGWHSPEEWAALEAKLKEAQSVFILDRDHQTSGPKPECACPSCMLHHVYQAKVLASEAAGASYRARLEELLQVHEFIDNEEHHQTKATVAVLKSSTCGQSFLDERERHVKALGWFFKQLDEQTLVRNVEHDGEPDFHVRWVKFMQELQQARESFKTL